MWHVLCVLQCMQLSIFMCSGGGSRWTVLCCTGSTVTHCLPDIIWQSALLQGYNSLPLTQLQTHTATIHPGCISACFICCCFRAAYQDVRVKVRTGGVMSRRCCEPEQKPRHVLWTQAAGVLYSVYYNHNYFVLIKHMNRKQLWCQNIQFLIQDLLAPKKHFNMKQ